MGLSLDEIATALRALPERRTPTKADWAVLSRAWRALLRSRIEELETLQTRLTSCIGCGCLSLKICALLNADDRAAARGSGARYLLGDAPKTRTSGRGSEAGSGGSSKREAPARGSVPRCE